MRNRQTDFLDIGQQKGYIKLLNEGTRIHYVVPDKNYKFTDPDETMNRQSEAAKLRQEADAIVEAAKAEVEQILLAEDAEAN